MTYEDVAEIALAMPGVSEAVGGRELTIDRDGGWMLTLKGDGETIVVKLDWPNHDRLLEAHPDILFKTPHYEGYPALLARLEPLTPDLARRLLGASWENAPLKAKKRQTG